jgi:hypothetical protein
LEELDIMTFSRQTLAGALVVAALLGWAGTVLAADFIVESRTGFKAGNYGPPANYADATCANSSVKSSAVGTTAGIGCRYATNVAATATFTFNCPSSGTYEVTVTWPNSTNGDTNVQHTVNYEGGSQTSNWNQNQNAPVPANGNPGAGNVWNVLGSFPFQAGKNYTVVVTNPAADGQGAPPRMMADAVKWSISCSCADVPAVGTKAPHMAGDTVVRVKEINANATKVTVYVNGVAKGSATLPGGGTSPPEQNVTLSGPLAAGELVVATQTMPVC